MDSRIEIYKHFHITTEPFDSYDIIHTFRTSKQVLHIVTAIEYS